jgi:class 3 adenylate cyclase
MKRRPTASVDPPPGMVALLFTDRFGSTELIDRLGDDAAEELRRTHFGLLRQAVDECGGEEVKRSRAVSPAPTSVKVLTDHPSQERKKLIGFACKQRPIDPAGEG